VGLPSALPTEGRRAHRLETLEIKVAHRGEVTDDTGDSFGDFWIISDHFLKIIPINPPEMQQTLLTVKTKKRHMTLSSEVPLAGTNSLTFHMD